MTNFDFLKSDPQFATFADVAISAEKILNIDMAAAKKMVLQNDKKRASYYNYYSSKKWGDGATYDLCVNTGKVGIYGAAEIIKNYVIMKERKVIKLWQIETKQGRGKRIRKMLI